MRTIPRTVDTSCPALNDAWERFAIRLAQPSGIALADTEEALNWDAFLGRSIPFELTTCPIGSGSIGPDLSPLIQRGLTMRDLAGLWEIDSLRDHLLFRRENPRAPAITNCELLSLHGGAAGSLLCDAFRDVPQSSSHWSVRTLLQNAFALSECDYSFRQWLRRESRALGESEFPPPNFRRMVVTTGPDGIGQVSIETALTAAMGRTFHRAGADVAAHMLCDWQLGLWLEERTDDFDLFPHSSAHKSFAVRYPEMGGSAADFAAWWRRQPGCELLPPRLASASIACAEAPDAATD